MFTKTAAEVVRFSEILVNPERMSTLDKKGSESFFRLFVKQLFLLPPLPLINKAVNNPKFVQAIFTNPYFDMITFCNAVSTLEIWEFRTPVLLAQLLLTNNFIENTNATFLELILQREAEKDDMQNSIDSLFNSVCNISPKFFDHYTKIRQILDQAKFDRNIKDRVRKRSPSPEDYATTGRDAKRQRITRTIELANLPGWLHNKENVLLSPWVSSYGINSNDIIVVANIHYIVFKVISYPSLPYPQTALVPSAIRLMARPITS